MREIESLDELLSGAPVLPDMTDEEILEMARYYGYEEDNVMSEFE